MRGRLDLLARMLLIVLGSVILVGTAGVVVQRMREAREHPTGFTTRFPRAQQVAGIVDLMVSSPLSEREAIVRAANGVDLSARVLAAPPSQGDLHRAPRLEARVAKLLRSPTTVAAYVSPRLRERTAADGVEGFLARAVAPLPGGGVLVLDARDSPDDGAPRLFGEPTSVWLGALAVIVAVVAWWATRRETRPLRDLVRGIRAFDGSSVTVASSVVGASDIRRTAAAVAAMQTRVVDLLGERSLIVGSVSHDLRTLLTRMRLRVAALSDTGAQISLEGDLNGMDALLADALAFARGTTSGTGVHTDVDLADLVAAEAAEREATGDDRRFELVLEDAVVRGDAHALRRVVANLVDNAVKYGRSRVRVTTSGRGGRVELVVEDDGPGIAPDQRAMVLRPYQRGTDPRVRRLAGSGLGLAIVRQIVEAHGGALGIHASSDLGGSALVVLFDPAPRGDVKPGA